MAQTERLIIVRHQYAADDIREVGRVAVRAGRAIVQGFHEDVIQEYRSKGIPAMKLGGDMEWIPLEQGDRFADEVLRTFATGYTVASEETAAS